MPWLINNRDKNPEMQIRQSIIWAQKKINELYDDDYFSDENDYKERSDDTADSIVNKPLTEIYNNDYKGENIREKNEKAEEAKINRTHSDDDSDIIVRIAY